MTYRRNPQSLLTPAMRDVLHAIAKAGRPPMALMTPDQAKQAFAAGAGVLEINAHKMVRDDTLHIPTRDGATLRAKLWAEHAKPKLPVLLYFHGGGFTVGSPETHEALCKHLAHLAHCAVVSLDYRLAPEHRFPVAVHDSWDALNWLHQHGSSLGLDSQRLAVGGDSAGGTLAAVCALMARDAGLKLALQLLFYPGCGDRQGTPSHHAFAEGFLLDKDTVSWFFANYIDEADRGDWRFAPLNAPEHSGLCPAWIGLAECDPLVDEGVLYADALRMAAVPVDLEIYRGVVHGFVTMGRAIPDALKAHADAGRALKHAYES